MIHDELTRFAWTHVKTKGVYRVLAVGKLEADETPCVTYRNVHSGDVWTRPLAEFTDGRFVETYELTTPRLSPSGEMVERLAYRVANAKLGEGPSVRCEGPTEFEINIAREWVRRILAALATGSNRLSLGVEGDELAETAAWIRRVAPTAKRP